MNAVSDDGLSQEIEEGEAREVEKKAERGGGRGAEEGGRDKPIYQPCASTIRRKKPTRRMPVPTHR